MLGHYHNSQSLLLQPAGQLLAICNEPDVSFPVDNEIRQRFQSGGPACAAGVGEGAVAE